MAIALALIGVIILVIEVTFLVGQLKCAVAALATLLR